jgi:GNAT superfamily N-acetyltransferase
MIKLAMTRKEMDAALEIRYQTQFRPQGLGRENINRHDLNDDPITLICMEGGKIIAATTAFIIGNSKARLLHLGVLPEHQHKGTGKKMVLAMEKELSKRGVKKNIILARTYLKKFYSGLGYRASGKVKKYPGFAERGVFHRLMEKEI